MLWAGWVQGEAAGMEGACGHAMAPLPFECGSLLNMRRLACASLL